MEYSEKRGIWVSYSQPTQYGVRKAAGDKVRILIIESDANYKSGLLDLFGSEPDIEVVGEAATDEQALELADESKADIVIMDLNAPSMSGIEVTRALADAYPLIRVILLTTSREAEHLKEARRAGASAYVMKDAGVDVLLRTIHDVISGETPLFQGDAQSISSVTESLLTPVPAYSVGTGALITSNERTILKLLAEQWDNSRIAEHMGVPENMVRTYIAEVCRKLGLSGREAAAQYAREKL